VKREQFEALVRRLEGEASRDPAGYRLKVGLLAALGYGFILAMLVTVLLLLVGVFVVLFLSRNAGNAGAAKLFVILIVFAFILLRALYVRFQKPDGLRLTRADAPELFRGVDEMTRSLGAPKFHNIFLSEDFNASVYQRPRLGVLGWQENNLIVGLPLMQALSPDQFRSVVAHELGHLRGGHGRFSGWVYRVEASWARLIGQLEQEGGIAGAVLSGFLNWYGPVFKAWSFPLMRIDEYEADRCAGSLTNPRIAADALCLLPAQNKFLEEQFWKGVRESVKLSPTPPEAPFSQLVRGFHGGTALRNAPDDAEAALREALRVETGVADTHPALVDRLKALGEEARIPPAIEETAAERFFGPNLLRLASALDGRWRQSVAPAWQAQHGVVQQERQVLAQLDARSEAGTLSLEERMQRAGLVEEYRTPDEALPLYYAVGQMADDGCNQLHRNLSAAALYNVGRLLLDKDDANGITYLDAAMERTPDAVLASLQLIHNFHKRRGDDEAAREVYRRAVRQADLEDDAAEEREKLIGKGVRYLPHGLSAETVERIRSQVAANADVAEAYLARKELVHFPDKPLFVLGVTLTHGWRRLTTESDSQRVAGALAESVTALGEAGEFYVVTLTANQKALQKYLLEAPGAAIYRSGK